MTIRGVPVSIFLGAQSWAGTALDEKGGE